MKEKIMNFAKDNWEGLTIVGAVIAAEVAICKIYKDWLYKL